MAEWIFPSNTKYYRVDDAFRELVTLDWRQNSLNAKAEVGDTVYIYCSSPVSAIRWKCTVTASHKNPGTIDDGKYNIPPMPEGHWEAADCVELRAEQELNVGALLDYKRDVKKLKKANQTLAKGRK